MSEGAIGIVIVVVSLSAMPDQPKDGIVVIGSLKIPSGKSSLFELNKGLRSREKPDFEL